MKQKFYLLVRPHKNMDEEKRKRLEAKGFKVTTVTEFLDLTPEEALVVESRLLSEVVPTLSVRQPNTTALS